ncbi:MAG: recombinase family protein, partial [Isosphaeraceae bacterium]
MADAAAVKRPQLERALRRLRTNGILVVWRLDRLGRNLRHLLETVEHLEGRGIGFRSLDDNIDTTTVIGKLMFRTFAAALAKFERDLRQEKQLENRRARSRPGARRPGPKPKLDEQKLALAFQLYYDQGLAIADVCQMLDISR